MLVGVPSRGGRSDDDELFFLTLASSGTIASFAALCSLVVRLVRRLVEAWKLNLAKGNVKICLVSIRVGTSIIVVVSVGGIVVVAEASLRTAVRRGAGGGGVARVERWRQRRGRHEGAAGARTRGKLQPFVATRAVGRRRGACNDRRRAVEVHLRGRRSGNGAVGAHVGASEANGSSAAAHRQGGGLDRVGAIACRSEATNGDAPAEGG